MTAIKLDVFYIDLNNLEEECANHPILFIKYSNMLCKARQKQEEEKAVLDLTYCEIDIAIRKNPGKYDLPDKTTEAMIKNTIPLKKKYKEAFAKYMKAKEKTDTLQIYVNAFEHRKKMISNAVQLQHDQYFAKPYTPSGQHKEAIEYIEKQQARNKKKRDSK